MMVALLLAVVPAFGQVFHKISGVVVDVEGKPVEGARIDHGAEARTRGAPVLRPTGGSRYEPVLRQWWCGSRDITVIG